MEHLLYSSNEMFSSTHLIRQSKQIFDKINTNEISKAVILRDGKPSFILLDFDKYEKIMAEYSRLKDNSSSSKQIIKQKLEQTTTQNKTHTINTFSPIESTKEDDVLLSIKELEEESIEKFKDEHNGEIKEFWNK